MGRLARVLKGLGAFALLVVVLAGIPWALWHFVGWPLPHSVPSASQVGRALNHQGIPDQALVDALAVVVWIAWATLLATLLVEIPAALSGRRARHLPVAGILQPVASHLVAAIIVGSLALVPRAGHMASAATPRGGLSLAGRQPVAALVMRDAAPTDSAQPVATIADSSAPPAANAAATVETPSPPTGGTTTYVVQRGDTLWGIAQQQLGDPLRWSEIYQLNQGRLQPGGVTLTDPHWIDPGWTLVLPAASMTPATLTAPQQTTPEQTTPQQAAPQQAAQPSASAASGGPVKSDPSPTPAPVQKTPPASSQAPHQGPDPAAAVPHREESGEVVRLVSGSVVAGSFAAGVVSALVAQRLRRRRRYRPSPPRPGVHVEPDPESSGLRDLLTSVRGASLDDYEDFESSRRIEPAPMTVFPDGDALVHPDMIEVAARGDQVIRLRLCDWPGLTMAGPGAPAALRAWLATVFTRNGPYGVEILAVGSLGDLLFPGLQLPELRRMENLEATLSLVEGEMASRDRLLEKAGVPDATTHRQLSPEYPFPLLLIVTDLIPESIEARWQAMVASATRLGVGALLLAPDDNGDVVLGAAAHGQIVVGEGGVLSGVTPPSLLEILESSRLFGLDTEESLDLLGPVATIHQDDDNDDNATEYALGEFDAHDSERLSPPDNLIGNGLGELDGNGHQALLEPEPTEPMQWPAPECSESVALPIRVEVLGPAEVEAWGETVSSGLRASAYELLAWYALHPDGATAEAAIDALWPDVSAKRGRERFWTALGNLRSRLKDSGQDGIEIIAKVGGHYRADPSVLDVDLWRFENALSEAARAGTSAEAVVALEAASATYRGDFYPNGDALWVEPVREDLHRRALDAHIRLAVLHADAGRVEAAIAVLERTIELDVICEDAYRRLISLQIGLGRNDAAQRTWRLLLGRLAELDLEPEDATAALMRDVLTARSPGTGRHS